MGEHFKRIIGNLPPGGTLKNIKNVTCPDFR